MEESSTRLIEVTGPGTPPTAMSLTGGPVLVGRGSDCAIRLDHELVSRRHARLDRDPDGRWRVTDLRSQNGTRVGGVPVDPAGAGAVAEGRVIEIGPFTMRIVPGRTGQPVVRQLLAADDSRVIRTLAEIAPPKLAVEQLRCLETFSRAVLSIDSAAGRLTALCRLMLDPCMGGRWAVVIAGDVDDQPRQLCPVERAAGETEMPAPRLSRSLMTAARHRREPVLATNAVLTGPVDPTAMAMSVAVDGNPAAAVAVPLAGEGVVSETTTLLYAAFPPEYGTGEWLALCALAGRHYLQAESVWANIAAAGRLARLEADLERARKVQDRLIPEQCELRGFEVAVRFRPCHGVAGDYVDAIPLSDGRALFVIADVVGKGLAAAMVAMGVHTIVHAAARRWTGMTDLAAALDAHLVESLSPGSFVTLLAMTIDPADGKIEAVNAGHPPAVVFSRAAGGFCREVAVRGGCMLGPFTQSLKLFEDNLDVGESLLLFTDGYFEVFDAAGEMLDIEGLCRLVGKPVMTAPDAGAAVDAVVDLTDAWQKPGEPRDDRTLMLIRRRPA